jgi:molybdate transport system substrate-binding protein
MLRSARGIYLPDPARATAGIHFAGVVESLGIASDVRDRMRPYANGALAMRAMADAAAAGETGLVGCTQVSEILYTDGVSLVGELPPPFGLSTTYTAAVCTGASEPALAHAFVDLLTGDETRALRSEGGFA